MNGKRIIMNNDHDFRPEYKSNKLLTPSERMAKKKLRNELKFHRRVNKLQTRIRHAIVRNDPVVQRSAMDELGDLLSGGGGGCHYSDGSGGLNCQRLQRIDTPSYRSASRPSNVNDDHDDNDRERAALDGVLSVFRRLLSYVDDIDKERIRSERMNQIEKSRDLLWNMTKGTQSKFMFRDISALRGYARRKFHGRAALIIKSMNKLSPTSLEMAACSFNLRMDCNELQVLEDQRVIMTLCWGKLRDVERVCSLGCGPGNDAVGMISFLKHFFEGKGPVECVYMLDYYINEWRGAILDDLVDILVPEFAIRVDCEGCDVTNTMDDDTVERCMDSDIFLLSYLLTETRNNWDRFLVQLVDLARVGALFYFAEPTPWQLHRLMRICADGRSSSAASDMNYSSLSRLRFVWLDSSMHLPNMQKLDGRNGGPAILLGVKV
ncbi:hypothetical protein ACHAXA_001129 [Cyclostephanos tholiformis]|uniref:Uncharacterized protein n=1 Tax=Cyclostephanos tholiformis TaxID=382380 RepID=A0ABD3R3Y7_9STRA